MSGTAKRMWPTLATVAALLVLTGCSAAEPESVPTETQTVTATETATETIEAVPQACLDALDHADEVQDIAVNVFEISADGFGAVSRGDADGLDQTAEDITALTPDMSAEIGDYRAARDECRAAS